MYLQACGYGYTVAAIDDMTLADLVWLCEGIAKRQSVEWQMNAFTAYTIAAANRDPKKKMPPFHKWLGIDEGEAVKVDKRKLMEEARERGELLKQKLAANGRF